LGNTLKDVGITYLNLNIQTEGLTKSTKNKTTAKTAVPCSRFKLHTSRENHKPKPSIIACPVLSLYLTHVTDIKAVFHHKRFLHAINRLPKNYKNMAFPFY
jgi:hypothetical protein